MGRVWMVSARACLKWPTKPCFCDAQTAAQCPSLAPPSEERSPTPAPPEASPDATGYPY